jgi:hypothetical protein
MSERNILAWGHDGTKRNKFFFGWLKIKKANAKAILRFCASPKHFGSSFKNGKLILKLNSA